MEDKTEAGLRSEDDKEGRSGSDSLRREAVNAKSKAALQLPLVSVVVVCYNHAAYLRACLDSVVRQTYPHVELIVVDNASTDESPAVIRFFSEDLAVERPDIDFEPVFSIENGHEMGAILQGFPRTAGRYVIFVDGDDLLLPGCIATHVKAHLVSRLAVGFTSVDMYQSTGEAIVVGTGPLLSQFVMSRRGQTRDFCRMSNLDAFDFPDDAASPLSPADLHYVPAEWANEWVWSPSSGLCFRREAAALLLEPPPQLRAGADNYFVRGICALSGGIAIDRALAVYRLHGENFFSKHPALANIHTFSTAERGDLDTKVMSALVENFRANIPLLGERLQDHDIFVRSIDHFASIAPGLRDRYPYSSFTLGFLIENRDAIVRSFGLNRYRRWLLMRIRPTDISPLLGWARRRS